MAWRGAWRGKRADIMDQAYFVTASYAVSGLGIGALALWIFVSARNARLKVEHLEKTK